MNFTRDSMLHRRHRERDHVEEVRLGDPVVLGDQLVLSEAARRHGVSTESINRWRNRFVDGGKAAMEDGMPGMAGARGGLIERRQRAEIQELKLALAEATVQLRIWQKGSEYIDQVPSQTSRP